MHCETRLGEQSPWMFPDETSRHADASLHLSVSDSVPNQFINIIHTHTVFKVVKTVTHKC